jgi:hypothetical protein
MSAAVSEYELEALPELGAIHETGMHGETESEQFFGALANLARRGAGWVTAAGSPQRRVALWAARQALNRGLPALGKWAGGQVGGTSNGDTGAALGTRAASWLSGLLPQQEYEAELNPVRKIYPDAMMEHLGHAAAETHNEAEAEALAGSLIPLAARAFPRAAPAIMRSAPGLVCGLSGVVQTLRRSPSTRPLVRTVPAIVRGTANSLARLSARGVTVSPQTAVRALAHHTLRVLGSPSQASHAFRQSQRLDHLFHRAGGRANTCNCAVCHRCGARVR